MWSVAILYCRTSVKTYFSLGIVWNAHLAGESSEDSVLYNAEKDKSGVPRGDSPGRPASHVLLQILELISCDGAECRELIGYDIVARGMGVSRGREDSPDGLRVEHIPDDGMVESRDGIFFALGMAEQGSHASVEDRGAGRLELEVWMGRGSGIFDAEFRQPAQVFRLPFDRFGARWLYSRHSVGLVRVSDGRVMESDGK